MAILKVAFFITAVKKTNQVTGDQRSSVWMQFLRFVFIDCGQLSVGVKKQKDSSQSCAAERVVRHYHGNVMSYTWNTVLIYSRISVLFVLHCWLIVGFKSIITPRSMLSFFVLLRFGFLFWFWFLVVLCVWFCLVGFCFCLIMLPSQLALIFKLHFRF